MKIKAGDLITCTYKWGDEQKEGIGYVYDVGKTQYVGISCKDGGCTNVQLDFLSNIKRVEVYDILIRRRKKK